MVGGSRTAGLLAGVLFRQTTYMASDFAVASPQACRTPEFIESEVELDEILTHPSPELVQFITSVESPLLLLGGGGKMGPTLARLARRAAVLANHPLEVLVASRFTNPEPRAWLESHGVRTIVCDLFDPAAVDRLPEVRNLIYLVGLKFGTTQQPAATWAANTIAPTRVVDRYPDARIVALSTGNVYPLVRTTEGGAREDEPLTPHGEYANAAVARERVFEFLSQRNGTRVALLRLFYAVELRYGVLVDIGQKVYRGEPIPLGNGHVSCIWQGDANESVLRSLDLVASPPSHWNLCRPEPVSVREVAGRFARIFRREARFEGEESGTALVGDSSKLSERLGLPRVTVDTMIGWIAHWIQQGGRNLQKPTHFEVRDGRF